MIPLRPTHRGDFRISATATIPVGNVTQIEDEAQQTIYFNNARVPPLMRYTHDALYQLIQATGREAIGQVSQPQTTYDDGPRMNLPLQNSGLRCATTPRHTNMTSPVMS